MPLKELTLFGERDKVQIAVDRLKQFEPQEGYYLAFSGGKDSITIYKLAELADVKFDAHYHITTVDPPELVRFIKQYYPCVSRDRPEMSMFRLIKKNFWPPMRQQRYCCRELKEVGGHGRIVVTGVRWAESPKRAQRRMLESCFSDKGKVYLHPVIDWTNEDVWEFIHLYNLPYCPLYDEGFERLGCIMCPQESNQQNIQRQIEKWPKFVKAYINTLDKVIESRKSLGRKCTFNTGQELFDWWISRKSEKKQSQDNRLFD